MQIQLTNLNAKGVKIPLIFEENDDLPVVFLRLCFENAGKAYDADFENSALNLSANSDKISAKNSAKNKSAKNPKARIYGISRMFARLLNEGVDDKFFKDLEFRAINLGASSGFESFELLVSCLKEHLEFALKKLCELLENPRFEEKILSKLKTIALGELAAKNSDFDYLARLLLNKSVFEYDEFKSSNDGDQESIEALQMSHLRDFHARKISLSNLSIVAGGDIQIKDLERLLSPIFKALPKGVKAADKKFTLCKKPKDEILVRKDSEQAYIYFCAPFALNFTDLNAHLAKIALFVLGAGGFGSRLMEEVRVKRGLAYSVYAMNDFRRSYKRVFGYLQTKNESANEAISLVKSLFSDFVKKGVSQNELEQAKKFIIGSTPLRYESLEKRLGMAALEHYQGLNLGHYKKELDKIKSCSLKELNSFIKNHSEIANLSFARVSK